MAEDAAAARGKKYIRADFDGVVDAQSVRYEVPAVVLESTVKSVRTFYKCIVLVMDQAHGRMWCEAIGDKAAMEQLNQKFRPGAVFCFRGLCFKKSTYHSGGKYIDLSKKQNVKTDPLPPTDPTYVPLQRSVPHGPSTLGNIADLAGLANSSKADLRCKVCDMNQKLIQGIQASRGREKTELWVKDASDKRVLVEAWGKAFGAQLRSYAPGQVLSLMNFAVRQNPDGNSVVLTGEHAGQSEKGSAFILAPSAEEVTQLFAAVDIDGGDAISVPWQPDNPQMSAHGPCFTACLASVKNSSLGFGTDSARPVASRTGGAVPAGVPPEVWLPEEVRVFVPGVWLTEVRDGDLLYTPCAVCKKKIQAGSTNCSNGNCQGKPSTEKVVLTSVTLADATGCLRHVLCRGVELSAFTGLESVRDLETCLQEEGHVSLPFRARCDVILGSQKATLYDTVTVANFELLEATPKLLETWDTETRPAPSYQFLGNEARDLH
eukprot:s1725_g21.t1